MLNKIILMGRLTKDPELRGTGNGAKVCKLSIAVNRTRKDKQSGDKIEETDFFDCDVWGSTGETVGQYFRKGDMILVEGEARNNNWTDSGGVKHYGMRVNVLAFSFCGNSGQTNQQAPQGYQQQQPPQQYQQQPQNYQPHGYAPQQYQQAPPPQYQQPWPDFPPM